MQNTTKKVKTKYNIQSDSSLVRVCEAPDCFKLIYKQSGSGFYQHGNGRFCDHWCTLNGTSEKRYETNRKKREANPITKEQIKARKEARKAYMREYAKRYYKKKVINRLYT